MHTFNRELKICTLFLVWIDLAFLFKLRLFMLYRPQRQNPSPYKGIYRVSKLPLTLPLVIFSSLWLCNRFSRSWIILVALLWILSHVHSSINCSIYENKSLPTSCYSPALNGLFCQHITLGAHVQLFKHMTLKSPFSLSYNWTTFFVPGCLCLLTWICTNLHVGQVNLVYNAIQGTIQVGWPYVLV